MRVAFYTLGCKVNQYETQALEQLFAGELSLDDNMETYIQTCVYADDRDMLRRVFTGDTLLRELQDLQLAVAPQALGVLLRRLDVEALLELPHTEERYTPHGDFSRVNASLAVLWGTTTTRAVSPASARAA